MVDKLNREQEVVSTFKEEFTEEEELEKEPALINLQPEGS